MHYVRSIVLMAFSAGAVSAQGLEYIKANYTKYEHYIPMRDGKRLFTSVYLPKDDSQPWPIMFDRTPYSVAPYGEDAYRTTLGPSELFARDKFIFVYQDVRGRYMSEGEFVNMRPEIIGKDGIAESTDTYDSIEWLVKNIPNNNGRVGMWGISYPGFYTAAGIIHAHAALKAASPQAPITDWFIGDDFHHNGALYLPHAFNFFSSFGHPRPEPSTKITPRFDPGTPDGYNFFQKLEPLNNVNEKFYKNDVPFWNEITQHPNYDAYWQARNLRPHLKEIKPAVMTVGGWFDAEDLFGALNTYYSIEKSSPNATNILVMGPWFHGGWARSDGELLGNIRFNSKTAAFFRESIELPFFQHYLKNKGAMNLPEAYVFETGTNVWRQYEAWPPRKATARRLYLGANGRLSFEAPAPGPDYDEYVSDPGKPVPFIGSIAYGMTREHMTEDQRFAATRPDVAVYQTEPLTDDITLGGPLRANLHVSTSGADSDFVVKLIDVYPDAFPDPEPNPSGVHMGGYQQLVRGEAMRGRFRNSYEKPEPFEPNKVTQVSFGMPDVNHTFRRGHRIMVQVQSTWFPLVDLNPQKFVDIYNAKATDFQKATQRIYHSAPEPSYISINSW
ncbi:MAG: peptidase [Bryobacterales bacterium]|nr:peptidase [Bryobacterales bacterium]